MQFLRSVDVFSDSLRRGLLITSLMFVIYVSRHSDAVAVIMRLSQGALSEIGGVKIGQLLWLSDLVGMSFFGEWVLE